ncbi:MAG: YfhO family protein, partial [Acidimicrobiales bacterium]
TSALHPGDARYVLGVRVPRPSTLVARITDVPGWHATADGAPLAVHRSAGDLVSVVVPAGTTTVVLHYWPARLTDGIALAVAAIVALLAWAVLGRLAPRGSRQRARRRRGSPLVPSAGGHTPPFRRDRHPSP